MFTFISTHIYRVMPGKHGHWRMNATAVNFYFQQFGTQKSPNTNFEKIQNRGIPYPFHDIYGAFKLKKF